MTESFVCAACGQSRFEYNQKTEVEYCLNCGNSTLTPPFKVLSSVFNRKRYDIFSNDRPDPLARQIK